MKATLKSILALAVVAGATQAAAQATFYEREGFQGDSFSTRRQVGNLQGYGFNDRAGSAVIAGESWERWQFCEEANFTGRCVVLPPGQYPSLRAMGLTGRIASVQTIGRNAGGPGRSVVPQAVIVPQAVTVPLQAGVPTGGVVFYERENFGGRSFTAQGEVADLSRADFNNRASSIEVVGGSWELCNAVGFGGPCVVLQPGRYPTLSSIGIDNKLSSVRAVSTRTFGAAPVPANVSPYATATAVGRAVFYEREGFGGRSFTAQGEVADLNSTDFNNRASSVEVLGGPWEVCNAAGYGAPCTVLRPGRYPSLAGVGIDNKISSVRPVGGDPRTTYMRMGMTAAQADEQVRLDNSPPHAGR